MSGLTDLTTQTENKVTTLPSWFSSAQQDAVNKAVSSVGNMPSIGNTVAGQAISNLSGPNNPFAQGQGTLNTIASGAANPWLVSATGDVTPNTNTALGGLFQAQNQEVKQLLPQYEAPATAGSVASGNFGSLRGQTAADTAVQGALATLQDKQMQAALTNQQTGVNASTGLGNVGTQEETALTNLGKLQQADPMAQAAALSTLLNSIKAPESIAASKTASPIEALGAIGTAYGKLPTSITGPVNEAFGGILGSILGNNGTYAPGIDQAGADQTGLGTDYMPGIDQLSNIWGS